jgi:hypothetical protein
LFAAEDIYDRNLLRSSRTLLCACACASFFLCERKKIYYYFLCKKCWGETLVAKLNQRPFIITIMPTCSAAFESTRHLSTRVLVTDSRSPTSRSRPRTNKDHRHDIYETLKFELQQSSIERGVQYSKRLTEEETENFRDSYRGLMNRASDSGVENKVLAHSFLQTNIYKSKADAKSLVKLLRGNSSGVVSCDAILEAANDETIHQRSLLKRYIRVLPMTPINLDEMSVSTGSLRSSWRIDRLPYPI